MGLGDVGDLTASAALSVQGLGSGREGTGTVPSSGKQVRACGAARARGARGYSTPGTLWVEYGTDTGVRFGEQCGVTVGLWC